MWFLLYKVNKNSVLSPMMSKKADKSPSPAATRKEGVFGKESFFM